LGPEASVVDVVALVVVVVVVVFFGKWKWYFGVVVAGPEQAAPSKAIPTSAPIHTDRI
jgi:hypothetical protein